VYVLVVKVDRRGMNRRSRSRFDQEKRCAGRAFSRASWALRLALAARTARFAGLSEMTLPFLPAVSAGRQVETHSSTIWS
jgi:hypothetical protein